MFLRTHNFETLLLEPSLYPFILASICLYILAFIISFKIPRISFEKRIFLTVFDAHSHLKRYDKLSGSTAQQKADLEKAIELLNKVSKRLFKRKKRSTKSDLLTEAYGKYSKLGEYIQAKILFYVKNDKIFQALHHITTIVNTFADINSQKLDLCLKSLEALPKGGDFKPPPSILESKPRLRSTLVHLGRFSICAIVVILVAVFLAYIFSTPISEFAPYILGSIFVLFVSWEFKSK